MGEGRLLLLLLRLGGELLLLRIPVDHVLRLQRGGRGADRAVRVREPVVGSRGALARRGHAGEEGATGRPGHRRSDGDRRGRRRRGGRRRRPGQVFGRLGLDQGQGRGPCHHRGDRPTDHANPGARAPPLVVSMLESLVSMVADVAWSVAAANLGVAANTTPPVPTTPDASS